MHSSFELKTQRLSALTYVIWSVIYDLGYEYPGLPAPEWDIFINKILSTNIDNCKDEGNKKKLIEFKEKYEKTKQGS